MDFDEEYGRVPNERKGRRPRLLFLILLGIPLATLLFLMLSGGGGGASDKIAGAEELFSLELRKEKITVDGVLEGRFYARGFNGSFYKDKLQFFSESGDLSLFHVEGGKTEIVISRQEINNLIHHRAYSAKFSPSGNYILISYDPQKVYRNSVLALYDVFDVKTKRTKRLSIENAGGIAPSLPAEQAEEYFRRIQIAKWSEDEDSLVFVHSNDIYSVEDMGSFQIKRVTTTGAQFIYNGICDWVYEEEMFSSNAAVWARGGLIAYVTFNDSKVDLIQFPVYGRYQYPLLESISYPKSGRQNPDVTISIYSSSGGTKAVQLPQEIPQEHYIGGALWTTDRKLAVTIYNRNQNFSWILLCNGESAGVCEIIHTMESTAWIDNKDLTLTADNSFISIESTKQGNGKSYKHLVEFNRNSVARVLTHGEISVDNLLLVSDNLYYTTKGKGSHLYKVAGSGGDSGGSTCLTCSLPCKTNDVTMSESGRYFVNVCHNGYEKVPEVQIYETESLKQIRTLNSNEKLKETLKTAQLPIEKRFSYQIEENNFTVNIKLYLPFDFDEGKKYPLLIDVYGGPGTSKMNSKYQVDWGTSLVSSHGIIYGNIDGRGSGGQSDDFMHSVYKRLGTVEVQDQLDGARWLVENLKYIDPERTAIWGWSYGGFVTAMAMGTAPKDIFRCGISVAPVTSWMFYDSAYTERYMGLPQENFKGYNQSDVTNYVGNFRDKNFLLIHGNADDNVHYQQSMYLSRALELNDILFYQQSYPDENHGLGSVRLHLYHTLERFLFSPNCLN